MNIRVFIASAALLTILSARTILAAPGDIFSRNISPAQNMLVFPNSKGEVVFSHSKHIKSLKKDHCILCHRIENPTLENIQSRFENHRLAHAFCKNCHRDLGQGPTECHQCHNYKKTT